MGCFESVPEGNQSFSTFISYTEQERRIYDKVRYTQLTALSNTGNPVSEAELELIKKTCESIQEIGNTERRSLWLEALHDDILSPMYYSYVEDLKYNENNLFIPDPSLLEQLHNKDFDTFHTNKDQILEALLHIFYEYIPSFQLDIKKLQRFLIAVGDNYSSNPFHNFNHAFAVTQMCFVISERTNKLERFVYDKDRLALMLCAVGHDLNHRNIYSAGVNNAFMINSKHPLALRYNDISVLENHHASTLFQILGLEGCDIFENLSTSDRNYMRKVMIPVILATDMAKHNEVMVQFRTVMASYNKQEDFHRQRTLDMILHTADVGNPALCFELATLWSLRIVQEFNEQVWKEEQLNLPVTEFMRIGNEISSIKKNQIGFISNF
jgi:hypothetical protein